MINAYDGPLSKIYELYTISRLMNEIEEKSKILIYNHFDILNR